MNISRFLTMRYLADKLANLFAKNATLRRQFDSHLYASDNHVLIDLADTGKEVDQADSLTRVQDAENRHDREVAAAIGNGHAIGSPLAQRQRKDRALNNVHESHAVSLIAAKITASSSSGKTQMPAARPNH